MQFVMIRDNFYGFLQVDVTCANLKTVDDLKKKKHAV